MHAIGQGDRLRLDVDSEIDTALVRALVRSLVRADPGFRGRDLTEPVPEESLAENSVSEEDSTLAGGACGFNDSAMAA